jgi:DNA-binding transcriptional ArsR family regulator
MATTDGVFKALADPTRREILRLLRSGPKSSGDIAQSFDSAWPTISRHLAVLKDAELVTTERTGSTVMYELDTTVFQETVEQLLTWVQPRGSNGKRRS